MGKRQLILEDGTVFVGKAFGSEKEIIGDVIFNTGMTGYQEMMTDPNYYGNIVTLTYPTIGNYGLNRDDFESIAPFINGLIVKEVATEPSNFRSEESLDDYLKQYNIPGISGIDTRALTTHIRRHGTLKGLITHCEISTSEALEKLKDEKFDQSPVHKTSITKPYIVPGKGARVVIVDLGMKHSMLKEFIRRDYHITVVPYNYDIERILRFKPDGIVLSNGPGNPAQLEDTIQTVKQLLGQIPLFGIGLGHQIFALACGATTSKMKVGHYGPNYSVKDIIHDKSWITTQSRQYTVDETSIETTDLQVTFNSLNNNTVEGLRHKQYPAFSVQFNPEGAPGPNETNFLFDQFLNMMNDNMEKNGVDINA